MTWRSTNPRALFYLLVLTLAIPPACPEKSKTIGDLAIRHRLPPLFSELSPGLSFTILDYVRQSDGQAVRLAVVQADPAQVSFDVVSAPLALGREAGMVPDLLEKAGAQAAVNASFYLPDTYEPTGLVVSRGKLVHPWRKNAGSGVFRARGDKASIDWAIDYNREWESDEAAVQAGPLIVEPGHQRGIYENANKRRSRTAVAIDGEGRIYLICTFRKDKTGVELSGLDLYELMELLMEKPSRGGLGAVTALNLDGGTSSAMAVKLPGFSLEIASIHPVRNALAVFVRPSRTAEQN